MVECIVVLLALAVVVVTRTEGAVTLPLLALGRGWTSVLIYDTAKLNA